MKEASKWQKCRNHVSNGTFTPQGEQLCQIILKSMHKCRSYGPYKLNLWLFYNLTWKKFQKELLLFKGNNCVKWSWNLGINVEVMARASSINDHFIIWPSSVSSTCLNKCFKLHCYSLRRTAVKMILKSRYKCRSYVRDKLKLWQFCHHWPPTVTLTFSLPELIFQMTLLLFKENKCAKF